jgi:aminoglycoside 6'-N-acetyltransferase I
MDQTITFRLLGPADLDMLLSVRDGLFDNPVDPVQARAFLDNPLNDMVLAVDGAEVVGFASGTVLQHPDKAPAMFVNEVGVRDGWLRRGIGAAVTRRLFDRAGARGCQGIWLGTEPDNVAALALYRSLGGAEVAFVGFGWDDAL